MEREKLWRPSCGSQWPGSFRCSTKTIGSWFSRVRRMSSSSGHWGGLGWPWLALGDLGFQHPMAIFGWCKMNHGDGGCNILRYPALRLFGRHEFFFGVWGAEFPSFGAISPCFCPVDPINSIPYRDGAFKNAGHHFRPRGSQLIGHVSVPATIEVPILKPITKSSSLPNAGGTQFDPYRAHPQMFAQPPDIGENVSQVHGCSKPFPLFIRPFTPQT